MVFIATFNNGSVISWRSVLFVEYRENITDLTNFMHVYYSRHKAHLFCLKNIPFSILTYVRYIQHLMVRRNYRIQQSCHCFYALLIGGDNGPYVYATNTSGSWTDGMLLTMTIDLSNNLPVLSHYTDSYIMGRYVIYVPASTNVDLCEVEVVGRCLFLQECRLI
jgi:hypothetical protein